MVLPTMSDARFVARHVHVAGTRLFTEDLAYPRLNELVRVLVRGRFWLAVHDGFQLNTCQCFVHCLKADTQGVL